MDKKKKFLHKLSQDQVTAMCLLANKIFNDYLICCKMTTVEPESYFEKWMGLHIKGIDAVCNEAVWKIFMQNILNFRNSEGNS